MKHKLLLSLLSVAFFIQKSHAQCGAIVDAGPDIQLCEGDYPNPQILGSVSGDFYWFGWTPAAGLSSTTVLNPFALNVTSNRQYVLRADGWDTENLLPNGDFEAGNTGFHTELNYTPGQITAMNTFTITDNAANAHPSFGNCVDHTSGSGNMMLFNTSISPQTVRLDVPNVYLKSIRLRFWTMNPSTKPNNTTCSVLINSVLVGNFAFNGPPCTWVQQEMTIFSVFPTMAIQFFPGAGGFGALDDFEVVTECSTVDTVNVFYQKKVTKNISATICQGDSYQVGNEFFDSDGIFAVPLQGNFGCDSTVILTLNTIKLPSYISPLDPAMNCITPSVLLSGPNPGALPPVTTMQWTTPNGVILGNPNAPLINAGTPGIYNLKLSYNGNGLSCSDSTFVEVTPPVDVPVANAGPNKAIGCAVATATLSGSYTGGTNFYPTWTTPNGLILSGQNTLNPVVGAGGMYILAVTNFANGCKGYDTVFVSQNTDVPLASAGNPTTLNCAVSTAVLNGTAATGPDFEFTWTTPDGHFLNGQNTLNPTVDQPGQYVLTVLNKNTGCVGISSVTIPKDIVAPDAQIGAPFTLDCLNPSKALFGNTTSGFPPVWTTVGGHFVSGQNTFEPVVDEAGIYFMKITNPQNHCETTVSVQISKNTTPPNVGAGPSMTLNCTNPTVALSGNLSAGGANPNILWTTQNGSISAGQNTLNPTVSAPGEYVLTVNNPENGCSAAASTIVGQVFPPVVEIISSLNLACFGQNLGMALASATLGSGSLTYLWSNGQTGPTAQNLPAGQVSVVVTDADGCTGTASVNLSQPPELVVSAVSTGQTIVNANDGTASASAVGGTFGYSFIWSNGQNTAMITGLAPGVYIVTATDANGCTATATTVVAGSPCQISMTGTVENVACNGSEDGEIAVQIFNETAPVGYVWSNGMNTQQITGLPAGSFSVTATDASGCTVVENFTISQPDPIAVSEMHQNVQCPADLTGSATVVANGGTPGFSFLWGTGETTATISGVGAGIYQVVVTDANGCTADFSVEIISADLEPPTLLLKNKTFSIDANGKATVVAADFDNGSMDNCSITNWSVTPESFDCTQLGLQLVVITATDGAGNSTALSVQATIIDDTPPVLTCPASKEAWWCSPTVAYPFPVALDNCLGNGGQFEFLSGQQSGTVFPIGVTTNVWKYTDGSGNSSTCSFDVTVFDKPTVSVTDVLPSCSDDCDGSLTANLTGGQGPFSFDWGNGLTTPTIINICPGTYQLVVTDGGGCSFSSMLELNDVAPILLSNPLVINDLGNAGVGAITVDISGGTMPYSFEWTKNGQFFSNNQNLTGLQMGQYVLQVTDANGCVFASQVLVVDNVSSATEPDWATGMLLRPNPTSADGFSELVFKNKPVENVQIEVFDVAGKRLELLQFDGLGQNCPLDFSQRPAGVYQLRIVVGGAVANRSLIRP